MKSKVISISAIASALVAISLTVGCYVEVVEIVSLVVSSVFVILPLYYKSFKGSVLCFLAGGLVALLCSLPTLAFSIVLPAYAGFFGLYPIIKHVFLEKRVSNVLQVMLGLTWCVLACFGVYFLYTAVIGLTFEDLPKFITDYILIFVGIFGVVFYFVFDRFIVVSKRFLDFYLKKIIK